MPEGTPQDLGVLVRQLQARGAAYFGTTAPASDLGRPNDLHIDTVGLDVYQKTDATTWVRIGGLTA